MKHLFLAAALVAATFCTAIAGERPSKAENEAAMKAGRKVLAVKVSELEKDINSHNAKASGTALDVLKLMQNGLYQSSVAISYQAAPQQKTANQSYNKMEMVVYEYKNLTKDVSGNGKQLVDHAHTFLKQY